MRIIPFIHRPPRVACGLLLLTLVLASLPALAQLVEPDSPPATSQSANWSEFGLAESERDEYTVRQISRRSTHARALALRDPTPAPQRAWSRFTDTRKDAESFNCVLSVAVGGEFGREGYAGTSLFGRAVTLKR